MSIPSEKFNTGNALHRMPTFSRAQATTEQSAAQEATSPKDTANNSKQIALAVAELGTKYLKNGIAKQAAQATISNLNSFGGAVADQNNSARALDFMLIFAKHVVTERVDNFIEVADHSLESMDHFKAGNLQDAFISGGKAALCAGAIFSPYAAIAKAVIPLVTDVKMQATPKPRNIPELQTTKNQNTAV